MRVIAGNCYECGKATDIETVSELCEVCFTMNEMIEEGLI